MKYSVRPRAFWIVPAALAAAVVILWLLPAIWYTQSGAGNRVWFTERTMVEGWSFESVPISGAAERVLVADSTFNGEFRKGDSAIRVFSAKRYKENSNEIGLFVHTPDRCWVEGGWKIHSVTPDVQEVMLHGIPLTMERRLFRFGNNQELVYFCGLVDGQVLPYRLDHNLSVGLRTALRAQQATSGTVGRASDAHFWQRLWSSFTSRRSLSGPKQFIRISTPVHSDNVDAADERLQQFLGQWLSPGDFVHELASHKAQVRR